MKLNPLYLAVHFQTFGKSTVRITMPMFHKIKIKKKLFTQRNNLTSKVSHKDFFAYEAHNWTTSNCLCTASRFENLVSRLALSAAT